MIGSTIAQYRVLDELGRGGMGIVYLAEDTRLERKVALKVLPPAALASGDDRARFYREAKAAAALNHPHIAQIYQIDEAIPEGSTNEDVRPFIAMEFVEGRNLSDRIQDGPLPLEAAIQIAIEVANALKAAHSKNIVHRDIKSANIVLTLEGRAKVLDFGLAKTTHSTKLTKLDSTLGTVAYMSPEQARGEDVDGRSDLYSLGTVLYEMIAGRLPFDGAYDQAVVYSILNSEPEPLTALRTGVPMELERITNKLLSKSAELRYQSAAGLISDLKGVNLQLPAVSQAEISISDLRPASANERRQTSYWWVGAAFILGAGFFGIASHLMSPAPERNDQVHRFEVILPTPEPVTDLSISRDGSTVAYMGGTTGTDFIYIYDLATGESRALEGTEGAQVVELNEDGSTALITTAIGVSSSSTRVGAPVALFTTQEGTPRANWAPDDRIVYEELQRVFIYRQDTGEHLRVQVTDTTGVSDLDWPSVLPDGNTIMATIEYTGQRRGLGFWNLDTGEEIGRIRQGGYRAHYVKTGHIIMVVGSATEPGTLVAMPFDIRTLQQTGPLIPLATGVVAERMSISDSGTLIFGYGGLAGFFGKSDLQIMSFNGSAERLDLPSARYNTIKVSPNGDKAVVSIVEGLSTIRQGDALDTYVLDLDSEVLSPLTTGMTGGPADWYAGADSVMYVDNTQRSRGLVRVVVRAANGTGEPREVFRSTTGVHDLDVAPDGSAIAYTTGLSSLGTTDLEIRSLITGNVTVLSDSVASRYRQPTFSPDGAHILYQKDGQLRRSAVDGTGVASTRSGGGALPAWDSVSGRMFGYGPISMVVWRGLNTPEQEAISVPGRLTAMDVFPGGNTLLVAVEAPEILANERSAVDSIRTMSVVLNLFAELE